MVYEQRTPLLAAIGTVVALTLSACNCSGAAAICQSTTDCGAAMVCLATQTCSPKCTSDTNCASTEKCSALGGCVPKSGCGSSKDCDAGTTCVAGGTCSQTCATDPDCGAQKICLQNHTCAAKCASSADCPAGQMLKCSTTGSCIPSSGCGTDADCLTGQICDSLGKCTSDCRSTGCNPGAYCETNGQCIATNNPDGGQPTCGGELFQSARVNSNMLIALDKSGSMTELIGGVSKWNIATAAVRSVTSKYEAQIQFGLQMFPAGNSSATQCVIPAISVGVGDLHAGPISIALDGGSPGGRTPIGAVLTAAGSVAELADPARANYVMLVTDGMETCNGNAVTVATSNLANKGIKTFVVGFGSGVDATLLSNVATAGGTARPGTPKYYQADDAAGINAAFNQIAQGALGCEYKLTSAPPDPTKLFVYVNGVLQNRDAAHANGWDYSAATLRITFFGSLCTLVANDATAKVSIVYGCRDDGIIEGDRRDGGAKLPNGAACVVPGDCANGQCIGGICGLPVGSNCMAPSDCASQVCTSGKCQPGIG